MRRVLVILSLAFILVGILANASFVLADEGSDEDRGGSNSDDESEDSDSSEAELSASVNVGTESEDDDNEDEKDDEDLEDEDEQETEQEREQEREELKREFKLKTRTSDGAEVEIERHVEISANGEIKVEIKRKIKNADGTTTEIKIYLERDENGEVKKIKVEGEEEVEVEEGLEIDDILEENESNIMAKLSNGRNAEIKIMPDTASETALAKLRLKVCSTENNCTIQLKETGRNNETKLAYEIKVKKQSRVLGLFKAQMQVEAQVNAETGDVISEGKPWWAFLASEEDELEVEGEN